MSGIDDATLTPARLVIPVQAPSERQRPGVLVVAQALVTSSPGVGIGRGDDPPPVVGEEQRSLVRTDGMDWRTSVTPKMVDDLGSPSADSDAWSPQ